MTPVTKSHGLAVHLSIVKEEIGIARQTMPQVYPGQRGASSQMKWRAHVAGLQEAQCRGLDYATVEGGHA